MEPTQKVRRGDKSRHVREAAQALPKGTARELADWVEKNFGYRPTETWVARSRKEAQTRKRNTSEAFTLDDIRVVMALGVERVKQYYGDGFADVREAVRTMGDVRVKAILSVLEGL